MPDSTLDARIAEARKEADAKWSATCFQGNSPDGTLVGLNDRWLTAFATALLASERSARADLEAAMHKYRRDCEAAESRVKELEGRLALRANLEATVVALRSQVASAKREGAREALEAYQKSWQGMDESVRYCSWRHLEVVRDIGEFRDREYPAPATPPERVSVTVEREADALDPATPLLITVTDSLPSFITIDAEQAKRIVALAGGAE